MDKNIKKIAFFTISMCFGGTERVISLLLKGFIKKGYIVYLILLENEIRYDVPKDVHIIYLHKNLNTKLGKFFSLLADPIRLARILKKKDVNIVVSFLERPNIINILSSKIISHRVVVSVRSILSKEHAIMGMQGKIMNFFDKIFLHLSDKIIPNSDEAAADLIKNFLIPKYKIKIIENPVDADLINRLKMANVSDIDFNKLTIINVGRFHPNKGHYYLIKAFQKVIKRIGNVQLLLIGDGQTKKDMQKFVDEIGIKDKVMFLGFQKNPFKYIYRSTIFVLPSIVEGMPNVILESIACGAPVISTNCSSSICQILSPKEDCVFKEGIFHGKYGIIVEPKNVDALYEGILYLLKNKQKRLDYINLYKPYIKKYSIYNIVLYWEHILEDLSLP